MLATTLAIAATSAACTTGNRVRAVERVGSGPDSSMVFIDFGPRAFAFDVRYAGSISGFAALTAIDDATPLSVESVPFGSSRFVTSISYHEFAESGDGSGGNDYWGYWLRNAGAAWSFSGIGATFRTLRNGDADGWVWTAAQPNVPPNGPIQTLTEPVLHDVAAQTPMLPAESRYVPEPSTGFAAIAIIGLRRRRK